MKRPILLFLSFIVLNLSYGQNQSVVDSLNRVLSYAKIADSNKVNAYLGLGEQYYLVDPDTAIFLCKNALDHSIEAKYVKGESEARSWLGYLYSNKGDQEKAISEYRSSIDLYKEIDNEEGISTAYNNIGSSYRKLGLIDSALFYFNRGLAIRQKLANFELVANSLNNIGTAYHEQGDVPLALENYIMSMRIKEHLKDSSSLATSKYNIGYIYNSQGDTAQAMDYFQDAKQINEAIGSKAALAMTLVNIGNIYNQQGNSEQAILYTRNALDINNEIGSPYGQANSMYNLGFLYKDAGNLDSAMLYIKKSLVMLEAFGIKAGLAQCYISIGQIHHEQGNASAAKTNADKGLEIAREVGSMDDIKDAAEILSKIYEKENNGTLALEMHKLFVSMRDSLENIEDQKEIIEQSMQYEFDKETALTKAEHEAELALTEAEKNRQSLILWGSMIGFILVVVFAVILISRLRIIKEKNQENELLLGEIHHRVKNNLQVISSLLSLQEKSLDDESAKKAILEGKERVKSMGLIHKMLYQNDNYSGIEMNDYIQNLLNGLMDSFGMDRDKIELSTKIDNLKLDVDSAIPVGLIINELVINSLKYAYEKTDHPKMSLKFEKQADGLHLQIADNGTGSVSSVENSKSFGFKLVKSLVRQVNGEMNIEDQDGLQYSIRIKDYKLV